MMPGSATLTAAHLRRAAVVYVRQSSPTQLERNTESTQRQYALVSHAVELGFAREAVVVIDEDLGISGSGTAERSGFARLTAEVALGHVGLVLGLEVTMSEAELHTLRARLEGGIRSKAARGELRRALPVGLVWGQEPGEVG